MSTDEDEAIPVMIYILPSERGFPPRALVGVPIAKAQLDKETVVGAMAATEVVWSQDMGMWFDGATPLPAAFQTALSERAKDLGVPGF